jgi:hypothetical protein
MCTTAYGTIAVCTRHVQGHNKSGRKGFEWLYAMHEGNRLGMFASCRGSSHARGGPEYIVRAISRRNLLVDFVLLCLWCGCNALPFDFDWPERVKLIGVATYYCLPEGRLPRGIMILDFRIMIFCSLTVILF